MPSHLRLQSSFDSVNAQQTQSFFPKTSSTSPPAKKQRMSLTQTYFVASTARSKLGREAGRPDHNLRMLVGHANLLDSLMVELADAEREQEAWFNQSVKKASKPEEPRHIQWVDTIEEQPEEDESDSDSDYDSDSDIYEEEAEQLTVPLRKMRSPPVHISSMEVDTEMEDEEELEYDDMEDDEDLALTRAVSQHSPPELTHDDSDSEDESMPSSPESEPVLQYTEKQREQIMTTAFYSGRESRAINDLQQQSPMIAAY